MSSFNAPTPSLRQRFETLSQRQREVCLLMVEGLMNKEMAERLGTTVHTIKAHRAEVMRRMVAHSLVELVHMVGRLRDANSATPSDAPATPPRVVVVEDHTELREILLEGLSLRGFTVIGASDAHAFDAAWQEAPADVVVLDVGLGAGREDGLSIAARLRATSSCGLVVVSAHGALEDRLRGFSEGADAYFVKPVDIAELSASITNLARRVRAR